MEEEGEPRRNYIGDIDPLNTLEQIARWQGSC